MCRDISNTNLADVVSESDSEVVYQINLPPLKKRIRVDKLLVDYFADMSRSQLQRLFEGGWVWSDEQLLSKSDKLAGDQLIQVTVPKAEPLELKPVDIPLDILYEDEHMIAINKAPGMVVHPGAGTGNDTLVHALLFHAAGSLSGIGGVERPGIVHRLDKETSGVIVVAKSDRAYQGLADQFANRTTKKFYKALVVGKTPDKGTCSGAIGRHPVQRMKMTVRADGRNAQTAFERRLFWNSVASLLDVQIFTGRTHQIRVHLSDLGFPLVGDALYGFNQKSFPVLASRCFLHAAELRLNHPITKIPMTLKAELPNDFEEILSALDQEHGPSDL